ncbi:response regulator [Paenibacillus senegalensis]|uniref:response regulator n=1 Tax=Paenibacillus senegalensis TaxID=1465766 RepID=UPI001F4609DF|nr:response regulator [Paenibacillus senegalensis]
MLVVDDEPYAVDYLVEALDELPDLNLTINKAYSGKEALAKIDKGRVDILLTDIRMPGMNGMELADEILQRWPRCRVIFLTGYDDFEYVQSALRKGGVDYVLKSEGDEVIVSAIEKSILDIKNEISEEQVIQNAREQLFMALPSLRRDYLLQMLEGEVDPPSIMEKRFQELGIDLDPSVPVLVVLGRIDDWGKFAAPANRTLLFFSIFNIADEYLRPEVRLVAFQYDRTRIVWLVQPHQGRGGQGAEWPFPSYIERIQMSCQRLLTIPLSVAVASEASAWELVSSRVEALKLQLTFRMGTGEEMLITEPAGEGRKQSSRLYIEIEKLRSRLNRFDLLEHYMDSGKKEDFTSLFHELFTVEATLFADGEGRWLGLELFSHLSAFFLSYMNKRRLLEELDSTVQAEKILRPDDHAGWHEMIAYFCNLGAVLADYNGRKQVERTHEMIAKVHDYIHQFLHEELSLSKLAELVYFSPPYFSRLYKQMTGQGVLEYINETRINKAKLLLKTTDRKIHEIAAEVGLESAPYFTRLFRKKTGLTPQEYRDGSKP